MGTLDIDLHGRTWEEALTAFIDFYNSALEGAGDGSSVRLTVIHGYGSTGEDGILRNRLRGFLRRFDDRLEFTPGEESSMNPGITLVTALEQLPDKRGLLEEAILGYCERPRSLSKITGRSRRHGGPLVAQAIKSLQKEGHLKRVDKLGRTMYETS